MACSERLGKVNQNGIPGIVAKLVVDFLEVIQINEYKADRRSLLSGGLQSSPAILIKIAPIRNSGKKIRIGHFFDFLNLFVGVNVVGNPAVEFFMAEGLCQKIICPFFNKSGRKC